MGQPAWGSWRGAADQLRIAEVVILGKCAKGESLGRTIIRKTMGP